MGLSENTIPPDPMVINGYHDISHWIAILAVSFLSRHSRIGHSWFYRHEYPISHLTTMGINVILQHVILYISLSQHHVVGYKSQYIYIYI